MPKGPREPKQRLGSQSKKTENMKSQAPDTQLRCSLHLNNNLRIFEELRSNIKLLSREHLSPHCAASSQPIAMESFKKDLIERYPDLFDAEEQEYRLDLAFQMAYKMHNQYMRSQREKQSQTCSSSSQSSSLSSPQKSFDAESRASRSDKYSCSNEETRVTDVERRKVNRNDTIPHYFVLPSNTYASKPQVSFQPNLFNTTYQSVCEGIFVHRFLDECIPTMVQYQNVFISFGCMTEEHIHQVSTWPQGQIRKFMQRLAMHSEHRIPQMDLYILEHQFLAYSRRSRKDDGAY